MDIFSQAIYESSVSLLSRSIFTDKGPIAKRPLVLQSGGGGEILSFERIRLSGASLDSSHVGLQLRLTGSTSNDDVYTIAAVLDSDTVRVPARLVHPDPNSGAFSWEVYDPRDGMVADDPGDVTVRVNGSVVVPEAVIGLRGQIVLPSTPSAGASVAVDYDWIPNPRVEIRRLNSKEFRLNSWNRDHGGDSDSRHSYRFNNVLVRPSDYSADDIRARREQPLLRDLKYRAFEREYSAVLNDPSTLLLNTPIHRIAYPPQQRTLQESIVFYEANTLPENDSWVKKGGGLASVLAGTLTVTDTSSEDVVFWTRTLDTTFDHVFSAAWRLSLDSVGAAEGVWTGVAAGYSDDLRGYVVGYLEDAGVRKIGFLRRGASDNLRDVSSWVGGVAAGGQTTQEPAPFDWGALHSYRIFRGPDGSVRLYVDGNVVETLRIAPEDAPFLEELNAPLDEIQGAFFGSLSRLAQNESSWDFYRFQIQPINIQQTSPSSFVSYEGGVLPELDASPWTPVGFHGTSTILGGTHLLIESTSATDETQGLISGDFRGYVKLEPLLNAASQFTVDTEVSLLTATHGLDPYGLTLAVDDGDRLLQLCFLADRPSPALSYGGRVIPEDFSPTPWWPVGGQPSEMLGRYLKISDSSIGDGLVYSVDDAVPSGSADRVVSPGLDYICEARFRVESYTPDGSGFSGAFIQVYDGLRSLGVMLLEDSGTRYAAFHSEGVDLGPGGRFAFEWLDGEFHTYRIRKSVSGDLVSLFVDGVFLGSTDYSNFSVPGAGSAGQISFGSATASSAQAMSVVDWAYCNAWRVTNPKRYVGLWKGTGSRLLDYHLPLKAQGTEASIAGNVLTDPLADFVASNIQAGDPLLIDHGPNQGVYEVQAVVGETTLTITSTWTIQPSVVQSYRVPQETDWSVHGKYRVSKDSSGNVHIYVGGATDPAISVGYNVLDLPSRDVGIFHQMSGGLPSVSFGSFSQEHLAQSLWSYVRYGITRTTSGDSIVPPHQVLNQWNVVESPERLTSVPPELTCFKSSSTGITPNIDPDFLESGSAFTRLNEGTPLVPQTQSFDVRGPFAVETFVSNLNDPSNVLNGSGGFTLNDGAVRVTMAVPDDVLYSQLQVVEKGEGEIGVIKPFDDGDHFRLGSLQYQKEVCLSYLGDDLPEDSSPPTPWTLSSDNPAQVLTSVSGGVLTYGTGTGGTRTAYLNNTPLPDAPSLRTEVTFRLRLDSDGTHGIGDSQVRFGLSAPGMTIGIGFVTNYFGERYVQVFDLVSGIVLGYTTFDYLDGDFHTYRIVRQPGHDIVEVFIDE